MCEWRDIDMALEARALVGLALVLDIRFAGSGMPEIEPVARVYGIG